LYVYWLLFALFAVPALFVSPAGRRRGIGLILPLTGVLMVLAIGLRYEVGADWKPYLYLFDWVHRSEFLGLLGRGDIGFYSLMWIADRAGLEIWAVNLLCAVFFVVGLFSFAWRQPSPWLTIAVAVPYLVIVVAMSATRQATAIGFIFLAIVALTDNRLWRAGVWIFFASLFHASSILMLGIAALSYTRNRFESILLVLLLAVPAYYLLSTNLEIYIERYSGSEIQSGGAAIRVAMNLVPAIIYLFFSGRFPDSPHIRAFWRNLSWLAVACVPLLILLPSSTSVDRLALYAIPLQMYVLGRLPVAIDPRLRAYTSWTLAIIGYLALTLYVFLYHSSHRAAWNPYKVYPLSGDARGIDRNRAR
jgi:hypothetical protein